MISGSGEDPRRSAPRRHVDEAWCDMGDVLDVSATGIRVRCKRKPPTKTGHIGRIKLRAPDGALTVSVRTVWMRRKGLLGGHEVGLQFVNLEPAAKHAIASLAEFGFFKCEDVPRTGSRRSRSRPSVTADMSLPDYYELLGVSREASDEEIRSAFRRLARQYHPDTAGPDADQDKFIQINQAYEILSDPSRRRQFDLNLAA